MGWNGSGGASAQKPTDHKTRKNKPSAMLLLAAATVGVFALALWFALRENGCKAPKPDKESKLIRNVAPATNRTVVSKFKRRPKTEQKATRSIGRLPDLPLLTNLQNRVYGEINGSNLFPRPLFKTREENHIAGLITAPPGARCVLNGFHPREEEWFRKSLDVPVEFEDRDTPEERATKEFMIEFKKELKERVAAGENMTDIVQELRRQRNELANMKNRLQQQFSMLQNEGTVEDIMQFYEEANGILAEYGMQPLALRSNKKEAYQVYLERKKQAESQKVVDDRQE